MLHNFERLLSVPPPTILYDWIGRDGTSQKSLTAGVLRQHALDEAQRLSKTTHKDAIIGIATSSGPDFLIGLIGCVYAGRTALPLPGTRPGPGRKRLLDAITAIKPSIILTTAAEINQLREPAAQIGAELQVIGTADLCNVEPNFGKDPKISILQFTSGTTGAAKAISLSSSAILANAKFTMSAYGLTMKDKSFSWLPNYHDMGLFGGLLMPLLSGMRVAQMDPLVFIQKPARWLKAVLETKATVTGGPAFALRLCLDQIPQDALASIDLSHVRAFYCGSEPIPRHMLDKVANRLAVTGLDDNALFATYGLAEATLFVAGRPGQRQGASCRIFEDGLHETRIVDFDRLDWASPETEGEIAISGPSLSESSFEKTQHHFEKDGRLWLRTGDAGHLSGGRLWITGRLKDVLIARGVNLPAVEVEWLAASLDQALNPFGAAAFSVFTDGVEHAVLLIERHRRQDVADLNALHQRLRTQIKSKLGLTLLTVAVISPGALPRTTSGKVSRSQAKRDYLDGVFWDPLNDQN